MARAQSQWQCRCSAAQHTQACWVCSHPHSNLQRCRRSSRRYSITGRKHARYRGYKAFAALSGGLQTSCRNVLASGYHLPQRTGRRVSPAAECWPGSAFQGTGTPSRSWTACLSEKSCSAWHQALQAAEHGMRCADEPSDWLHTQSPLSFLQRRLRRHCHAVKAHL